MDHAHLFFLHSFLTFYFCSFFAYRYVINELIWHSSCKHIASSIFCIISFRAPPFTTCFAVSSQLPPSSRHYHKFLSIAFLLAFLILRKTLNYMCHIYLIPLIHSTAKLLLYPFFWWFFFFVFFFFFSLLLHSLILHPVSFLSTSISLSGCSSSTCFCLFLSSTTCYSLSALLPSQPPPHSLSHPTPLPCPVCVVYVVRPVFVSLFVVGLFIRVIWVIIRPMFVRFDSCLWWMAVSERGEKPEDELDSPQGVNAATRSEYDRRNDNDCLRQEPVFDN